MGGTKEELEAEQDNVLQRAYKAGVLNEGQFSELQALQYEQADFIIDIVDMFLAESASMLEELQDAFGGPGQEPKYTEARAVLHKLKGSSSTVGAARVEEACEVLRALCVSGDIDSCRNGEGSIHNLKKAVDQLNDTLMEYVALQKQIIEVSE